MAGADENEGASERTMLTIGSWCEVGVGKLTNVCSGGVRRCLNSSGTPGVDVGLQ